MESPAPARYPAETELALRTGVILARCFASVSRETTQLIRGYEVTPPQFAVLEVLFHLGPLSLTELGRKLLVTSGNITYLVDTLCEMGLVKRERSGKDRRVVRARLTAEGTAMVERVFPGHAERVRELFAALSREEQLELQRLLKKLGLTLAARRAAERGRESLAPHSGSS